jgi:hypothetical protein
MAVPDLLAWAQGKVIVMFCVKETKDIARAITTIIENNATDRAFLEIHAPDVLNVVPKQPFFEQVYYLAELGDITQVDSLLNASSPILRNQTFMWVVLFT